MKYKLFYFLVWRICLIAMILSCLDGFSQENSKVKSKKAKTNIERYLTSSMMIKSVQLRDQHMSPVTYFGTVITPGLGFVKFKPNGISEFSFDVGIGAIQAKNGTEQLPMRGSYYRLDIHYAYMKYIGNVIKGKYKWYLGGKLKSHTNIRLNEQLDTGFITFILANGINITSALEREARVFNRNVKFLFQADLPLITHLIRPNYLNIYNYIDPENDWVSERFRDSDWLAPGKFSNFQTKLTMLYPIRSGNYLRLSYGWSYYAVNNKLKARNASHDFGMAFLFNF